MARVLHIRGYNQKDKNMSAPNFSFQRRCVLVTNDDYDCGNYPDLGKSFDGNRSYPSTYLEDYVDDFRTIAIVMTCGYYSDACIDIVDREDKTNEILGYANYYSNHNRQDLISDIMYFLGCSYNFANTRLKGCKVGSATYEYDLEKAFERIVDDWREAELKKANKVLDKLKKTYGYKELYCAGIFSNGEAIYNEI